MPFKLLVLTFAVIFCFFSNPGRAQNGVAITYGFKSDTLSIRAGETFSNTLWISNAGSQPVTLRQDIPAGAVDPTLLKIADTIRLQPGEKRWFPLKYIANRKTIKKKVQDITIRLKADDPQVSVQPSANFFLLPEEIRGLVLDTDEPEIYLNQLTNQVKVPLRCYNNSLFPVDFNIDITHVPEGLEFTPGENLKNIRLEPGNQTTITFNAINRLQRRVAADFAVLLMAVDVATQQELTQKSIRILSVSSDRRLGFNQTTLYESRPNTVALRYLNINNDFNVYQLQGNGKYTLADSQQVSYQVNTDYFNNPYQKGINIYDTYIDYENKKFGARLGNIYELLDFNLNGRGLKGMYKTGKTGRLSAYAVENNYLLYTNFQDLPFSGGNTFAAKYEQGNSESNNKTLIALHSSNSWDKSNTSLFSGAAAIPLSGNQFAGIEGGYSRLNFDNNVMPAKDGFAIGLKYSLSGERVHFFSTNYYSSPYYGGLRRGLLQIDNNLNIKLSGYQSASAAIRILDNRPKFMYYYPDNSFLYAASNYGNAIYELGYSFRLGRFGVVVRPYYFAQNLKATDEDRIWKSSSIRAKINLNYSYASHNLFIEVDNGYTLQNTSGRPPSPFPSSRINLNYKGQVMGFNALLQFNSYFITDAIALTNDNPKYTYLSGGPNATFALFRQALLITANTTYNYSGYNNTHTYSLGGNVRLRLKNNWAVTADGFYGMNIHRGDYNPAVGVNPNSDPYSQIAVFRQSNQQIRVGIEKNFGSNGNGSDKKLELVYFEDLNSNGYREKNEPAVNGLLVKANGITAITNAKGMVKFTGEKDKLYNISITNSRNLNLLHPTEVYLRKNMKMEVPLVKTELISGKMVHIKEKYVDQNASPSGLRVKAVADNGQVFSTLTNDNGDFSLYLPRYSTYTVSVETEGLHFEMEPSSRVIRVEDNYKNEVVFKYQYKEREIKVIHFD